MKEFQLGKIFLVVLVAFFAMWLGVAFGGTPRYEKGYSAVYLVNGDIYFGKLHWSKYPKLTDVWYVQRAADSQGQVQFSVLPWRGVSWNLEDEIHLNPKQILFWSRLDPNGEFAKLLANPTFRNQQLNDSQIPTRGVIPSSP